MRGTIEIEGKRSRWFPMYREGPQGSSFTAGSPVVFIVDRAAADWLTQATNQRACRC